MGIENIKMYGERNTGTNYLARLIDRNLVVRQLRGTAPQWPRWTLWARINRERLNDLFFQVTFARNLGWKHSLAPTLSDLQRFSITKQTGFVALVKNPYSWLLSLYRRPYHLCPSIADMSFESFVSNKFRLRDRDGLGQRALTPVEIWNRKNRSYCQLNGLSGMLLKFEELLANPDSFIIALSDWCRLPMRAARVRGVHDSTKESNKDYAWYVDYYLNERWRENLSHEAVRAINQSVDASLMRELGYELMTNNIFK